MAGLNRITAFLLVVIGLLQYRLWFGDGNMMELQRLNNQIQELRQEGGKRRERNAALEAEVMDLKQGLDAVEERARQDLGMIREGEAFVQVIDPHHEAEARPASPPAKPAMEKKPVEEKKPKRATRKARPHTASKADDKQAPPQPDQPPTQPEEQPADTEPPTDNGPD